MNSDSNFVQPKRFKSLPKMELRGRFIYKNQLNAIAKDLALINPSKDPLNPLSIVWKLHHNVLTGNYDIKVLFATIEGKGKSVVWYDHRNGASSMDLTDSPNALTSIILNNTIQGTGWFV